MTEKEMAEIYEKYKNSVYCTAFAYCKNISDAQDITHDVYIKKFECKKALKTKSWKKQYPQNCTSICIGSGGCCTCSRSRHLCDKQQ